MTGNITIAIKNWSEKHGKSSKKYSFGSAANW
jgi:hypothetical protein